MKDFPKLEKELGVDFKGKDLLQQAFTHKSYLNENPGFKLSDNERLEFLGDAVLELIVTEYLYNNYPNPEGELTNWRSALVKGETLSEIGEALGFNDYLYLSRGEAKGNGRARKVILANTFEAVIGAIYLDQGFDVSKRFIERQVLIKLPDIFKGELHIDPKSKFQEIAQDKTGITPVYKLLKEEGPDHDKRFNVGVFLNEKMYGEGTGPSKQSAEIQAAEQALTKKL